MNRMTYGYLWTMLGFLWQREPTIGYFRGYSDHRIGFLWQREPTLGYFKWPNEPIPGGGRIQWPEVTDCP